MAIRSQQLAMILGLFTHACPHLKNLTFLCSALSTPIRFSPCILSSAIGSETSDIPASLREDWSESRTLFQPNTDGVNSAMKGRFSASKIGVHTSSPLRRWRTDRAELN